MTTSGADEPTCANCGAQPIRRALEPFQGWEFRLSFGGGPGDEDPQRSAAGEPPGPFGPGPETRIH